jgi:hypothetical protein
LRRELTKPFLHTRHLPSQTGQQQWQNKSIIRELRNLFLANVSPLVQITTQQLSVTA